MMLILYINDKIQFWGPVCINTDIPVTGCTIIRHIPQLPRTFDQFLLPLTEIIIVSIIFHRRQRKKNRKRISCYQAHQLAKQRAYTRVCQQTASDEATWPQNDGYGASRSRPIYLLLKTWCYAYEKPGRFLQVREIMSWRTHF